MLKKETKFKYFGFISYTKANTVHNNKIQDYFIVDPKQTKFFAKKDKYFIPECITCGHLTKDLDRITENSTYLLTFLGINDFIVFFCSASCQQFFNQEPQVYLQLKEFPNKKIHMNGLGMTWISTLLILIGATVWLIQ